MSSAPLRTYKRRGPTGVLAALQASVAASRDKALESARLLAAAAANPQPRRRSRRSTTTGRRSKRARVEDSDDEDDEWDQENDENAGRDHARNKDEWGLPSDDDGGVGSRGKKVIAGSSAGGGAAGGRRKSTAVGTNTRTAAVASLWSDDDHAAASVRKPLSDCSNVQPRSSPLAPSRLNRSATKDKVDTTPWGASLPPAQQQKQSRRRPALVVFRDPLEDDPTNPPPATAQTRGPVKGALRPSSSSSAASSAGGVVSSVGKRGRVVKRPLALRPALSPVMEALEGMSSGEKVQMSMEGRVTLESVKEEEGEGEDAVEEEDAAPEQRAVKVNDDDMGEDMAEVGVDAEEPSVSADAADLNATATDPADIASLTVTPDHDDASQTPTPSLTPTMGPPRGSQTACEASPTPGQQGRIAARRSMSDETVRGGDPAIRGLLELLEWEEELEEAGGSQPTQDGHGELVVAGMQDEEIGEARDQHEDVRRVDADDARDGGDGQLKGVDAVHRDRENHVNSSCERGSGDEGDDEDDGEEEGRGGFDDPWSQEGRIGRGVSSTGHVRVRVVAIEKMEITEAQGWWEF
ncbi:hypothetical protein HK101_001246 [Irineochytrium annulatum]|nr:hypothetical protein HK101_001246 [Irineochytrium annulatum]